MQKITKGQAFILGKRAELDAQTRLDVQSKKLRYIDADYYLRAEITGKAGIQTLLDETNVRKVGTTNFNENKLPKGVNLALEKIRFGYATHASEVNPANMSYTNKLSTASKVLQNAEFRIKVDNKIYVNLPVARLMAENISNSVQGKEDACVLDAIQLIKENTPIAMEIEYPTGLTVDATAKHHIEIRLIGTATAPR